MTTNWLTLLTAGLLIATASAWAASDKAKGGQGAGGQAAKQKHQEQTTERVQERTGSPEQLRHRDRAAEADEQQRDRDRDQDRDRDDAGDAAQGRGNATSQEMQNRKAERKEIKGDYKEARKSGEVDAGGKKPWWKFWEEDAQAPRDD